MMTRILTTAGLLGALGTSALLVSCSSYGPRFDPYSKNTATPPAGAALADGTFETVSTTEKFPSSWLRPSPEPYRLGPGDQLTIEVVGIAGTTSTTFITPDGKIYYQNLSGVKVKGMTLPELKKTLESKLANWYQNPQVSVSLNDVKSQRVWIMGRVANPGVYSLARPTTVVEAISQAGGISTAPVSQLTATSTSTQPSQSTEEDADLSRAFLIRDSKFIPIDFKGLLQEGQMQYNVYLQSGDYIYIPGSTAKEVFVLGSVVSPQVVRYRDDMSLVSAIAYAGGPTKYAHVQHVVVIRGSLTQPKVAVLAYKDIVVGQARDIALQPHDIVWVPKSPWERVDLLVRNVLSTFVRTVAVNEGARFADPNARTVGTSINVGPVINTSP